MANTIIWVGEVGGDWYSDVNDGDIRKLAATPEQIHSALAANGWVRISKRGEDDGVTGNYAHSNNWPLDQSAEPLKEFYA